MEVNNFQRLSFFKIWSGWISATQKRGGEFCNYYEYTKKKWRILEPGFNAVLNFASNTGFSTHFHCWIVHCLKPWFISRIFYGNSSNSGRKVKNRPQGRKLTVMVRAKNGSLTKIGVVWQKSDFWTKNRNFGPKKRESLLGIYHVLATTGKSCSKKKVAFAQIIKGGNVILGDFLG